MITQAGHDIPDVAVEKDRPDGEFTAKPEGELARPDVKLAHETDVAVDDELLEIELLLAATVVRHEMHALHARQPGDEIGEKGGARFWHAGDQHPRTGGLIRRSRFEPLLPHGARQILRHLL